MECDLAELPKGWTWATYEQIGKWSGGGTPSKRIDSYWTDGDIPWISPKDMKTLRVYDSKDKITDVAIKNSSSKLIPSGSLLFVVRSGILRRTLPVALIKIDAAVNQDLKALTTSEYIFDEYLLYHALAYNEEIRRSCAKDGTTVESIEFSALKKYRIPLAPLPEQHRIVARIEELFSRLDAGVEALQRAKAQLRRYRQAVLKAAVEGRLTEQWRKAHPEVEPAKEALRQILKKDSTESVYSTTYKLPSLPITWKWVALETIADAIDPQPSHRTPPEVDVGVPYIGIGDINEDGTLNFDTPRKVSLEILEEHRGRYQLEVGDFIFGKIGTLGRPAKLTMPFDYTLSANVILIKPNLDFINQNFLFSFMESPMMDSLLKKDSRATTQAAFGIKKVRLLPIPLPPTDEQNIIVDRIEQLISLTDTAENVIRRNIKRTSILRQSILKHAFEGRLVPQDPADEPASVLLERIKDERAKAARKEG
jgi:type I restriction enzyme, S subunit